ncbi:MAG: rssA [Mucilaginibacter sp.]|jgi:NTE family protein|nr:rssA [Mucilaginibacter sp.]
MKQKVALVLSGGGARGIAHIGAIEELEKRGFKITSIAGTSMGALIGGVYALGKMEIYKDWLLTLDRMKVFRLVDFTFSGQGLVKGEKLFNKLRELIDDANIEDLKMPYAAIAADIINKKEVVFTKGSMLDAIRASIAIPTILTPVRTEDGMLVDGGVINSLPIEHVKRTLGDILVVVNVNAPIPFERPPANGNGTLSKPSVYQEKLRDFYDYLHKINPAKHEEKFGYFDIINKTMSLITYHTGQLSLEKYKPDILISISHECCGTFEFYKAEEMIAAGKCAAIKSLEVYEGLEVRG